VDTSYRVDWAVPVLTAVSQMWASRADRARGDLVFTRKSIDYLLGNDPHKYRTAVAEGLYKLSLPPLQVYFRIVNTKMLIEIIDVLEIDWSGR
jgi:hypothetical protein